MRKRDYFMLKSDKDLNKLIDEINNRGGLNHIDIINIPQEFPVVATYTLSNGLNGITACIKHIKPRELLELMSI